MATVKKVKKAQDGAKKFAALAPPYNKVTFADKIAGAKKSAPKAQAGKTVMQKLKSKYPSADTTAKGDVRGSEINAYGPKKAVKQYSDTYDAFDKKFNKGKSYRAGGKIKKAQSGKDILRKPIPEDEKQAYVPIPHLKKLISGEERKVRKPERTTGPRPIKPSGVGTKPRMWAQAGLSVPPSKRVGPIDPNGAWTKVQEKTIAGSKAAKVPLKKDKQLGASKMKMGGKMSKKK